MRSITHLFRKELKDLYIAEMEIITALEEITNLTEDADMREKYLGYLDLARTQKKRLRNLCRILHINPESMTGQDNPALPRTYGSTS